MWFLSLRSEQVAYFRSKFSVLVSAIQSLLKNLIHMKHSHFYSVQSYSQWWGEKLINLCFVISTLACLRTQQQQEEISKAEWIIVLINLAFFYFLYRHQFCLFFPAVTLQITILFDKVLDDSLALVSSWADGNHDKVMQASEREEAGAVSYS